MNKKSVLKRSFKDFSQKLPPALLSAILTFNGLSGLRDTSKKPKEILNNLPEKAIH